MAWNKSTYSTLVRSSVERFSFEVSDGSLIEVFEVPSMFLERRAPPFIIKLNASMGLVSSSMLSYFGLMSVLIDWVTAVGVTVFD